MSGACEYSGNNFLPCCVTSKGFLLFCTVIGNQAVAMPLGLAANFKMHKRVYLFSDAAVQYVRDSRLRLLEQSSESGSDSESENSFSSGIYSKSSSQSSEDEAAPVRISKLSCLSALTEEEEFGISAHSDNIDAVSDTDSEAEQGTHQRVESLLRRGTVHTGSVPLVRNSDGKLLIVPQIVDYQFRNQALQDYSLYELVCCTYRREITSNKKNDCSSSSDSEQDAESRTDSSKQRRGPKPTVLFHFQPGHPLVASHALALHKQHNIAQFVKKIPPYPGKRPDTVTDQWKTRARIFAEHVNIVYRPWTGPDFLPEATTWKAFCDWMQCLKKCDSIMSRTRYAFVVNAAHNLKYVSMVSKILKRYRGSKATRWLDMPPNKRPKAWMFGDENKGLEANLASKNSDREAALAMQELLQKICYASSFDTKKSELMQCTLKTYAECIQVPLQRSSVISFLFDECVPPLLHRVNCFTYETITNVQEQNLLKKSDQELMEKLKKTKKFKNDKTQFRPQLPSPISSNEQISWSPQQAKIVNAVSKFLEQFTAWKNNSSPPPPSLSMLIFGGPGVGKTTVLKKISEMCEQASMPLLSSAATGVAAGNMRQAGTNHSKFSMPVFEKGEAESNSYLQPLSQTAINILMQDFQDSLERGIPLAIAVDEVSMLSALTFGRILKRIEEFERQYFPPGTPQPPRLFILVGDFYQVSPVYCTKLF